MSRKEEYRWYKSIGICPVCHKTAMQKGYQTCLECRMKMREYVADRKSRMNAEQLGDISRRTIEANKRMYVRRKEANLCTHCGKRPADDGKTTCRYCREKYNRKRREQNVMRGGSHYDKSIVRKGTRLFCVIPAEPGEHGAYVCEDICLKRSDGMVYIKDGEFPVGYIGKSWFLNRAEAEKAMEASKSD